ncbi:PilW family protein [Deinococcus sp. QL22]|uniref:PilW family protein n=1 Tax=Deinococcus sp. QL22 TaxID=2939437 RepID=UPI0020182B72|nr:prepilin-type N-terminal cleavage/methylation domain-containing protein [Deinococcus sp. QL22]UQN05553.1 prepilin-type N-terminal cleavage/methylation domain-containing protein [Deinococcus sp. QL22]
MNAPVSHPVRVHKRHLQGITLIELLIGMALAVLVLATAFNLFTSSTKTASDLQNRNELQAELQIAQNYLAAQVREAVYVFPQGTTLNLGSGYTPKRPVAGSWRVGDNATPVLAFIRPPEDLTASCPSNEDGCYKFYAYYPLLRSGWVSGATSYNDPGQDPQNGNRWVLAEYRANYDTPPLLSTLSSAYTPPAGGQGRLLLDYLQPTALALAGTPTLFVQQDGPAPATIQTAGAVSVTLNFALSRQLRGSVLHLPGRGASTPVTDTVRAVTVFPRNLGSLAP